MNDTPLLHRIRGTVDALSWAPIGRQLGHDALINACRWGNAYHADGLPFSGSRIEADCLRRLVGDGYLTGASQTQGRSFKLSMRGIIATGCVKASELRAELKRIAALEEKSTITLPGLALAIVPGFKLVPSAGTWWAKANGDKYWRDLGATFDAAGKLLPLIVAGFVRLYPSSGFVWAVALTPEGQAALDGWPTTPDEKAEAWTEADTGAWARGWEAGLKLAASPSPESQKTRLPRLLPASAWR